MGDQVRTYARVNVAVEELIGSPQLLPGATVIMQGNDLTVNEIAAKYFPDKTFKRVPRSPHDIIDGRQVCP